MKIQKIQSPKKIKMKMKSKEKKDLIMTAKIMARMMIKPSNPCS